MRPKSAKIDQTIADSEFKGWVESMPAGLRPFLRLSRYDRPIGFWLLGLPGWIGLCFAALTLGFTYADIKWAGLIAIGAIAMRGAGCTYNDIVDRDLDAKVERTALRPLPAGTVSLKAAWIWLFAQCGIGALVLWFFPPLAQIIALTSLLLVAAYPFMKRITYWPQAWLGLTFNWAVLVAFVAKTGEVTTPLLWLYGGLVFWTIGYDTIYACQDREDDALIGVKSTARRFGPHIRSAVGVLYALCLVLVFTAVILQSRLIAGLTVLPFAMHVFWQVWNIRADDGGHCLAMFKSNTAAGLLLALGFAIAAIAGL